mmetsp:Transcript_2552/g.6413  ORF Transcript_2552/g.6413 Transcript_2552/m.6413 type:complete len:205 (+) Transcript_2552:1238-1852(+)
MAEQLARRGTAALAHGIHGRVPRGLRRDTWRCTSGAPKAWRAGARPPELSSGGGSALRLSGPRRLEALDRLPAARAAFARRLARRPRLRVAPRPSTLSTVPRRGHPLVCELESVAGRCRRGCRGRRRSGGGALPLHRWWNACTPRSEAPHGWHRLRHRRRVRAERRPRTPGPHARQGRREPPGRSAPPRRGFGPPDHLLHASRP